MLKKNNRLKTGEFKDVFKKGNKKFSQHFLFLSYSHKRGRKISVAISKKIERRAVDRVKSKRIIYNLLRKNFKLVPKKSRIIFLITKPILGLDKKNIELEIKKFFEK